MKHLTAVLAILSSTDHALGNLEGVPETFFSDKEEGAQNHLHKVHFHNIMTI